MDDDAEATEDERAVELATIAAIFPELTFDGTTPFTVSLELLVSPTKPFAIRFPVPTEESQPGNLLPSPRSSGSTSDTLKQGEPSSSAQDILSLSYLPPLILQVTLPDGYPSRSPPAVSVSSLLSWLPESILQEIKAAAYTMWEELGREQIVFSYIDFCQQAVEDGFGLAKSESVGLELPLDLKVSLLDFDRQIKRQKFEQETFECGVCLGKAFRARTQWDRNLLKHSPEPKKGLVCHRLQLCSHVFCVACLQDFYNSCIMEGDVGNVKCLTPHCEKETNGAAMSDTIQRKKRKKKDRTLDASELLQIPLEQETVQRYVKLKRKKILESDKTTVYCPRQWCQGAARSNKHPKVAEDPQVDDSEVEDDAAEPQIYDPNANDDTLPPPNERLCICEDCAFAFCKVCKLSWHGEFARCFPRRKYELTAEEKASEEYLRAHTTPCPTCLARCQKSMGCNHMICYKCDSHFCYLCSSWLQAGNPYIHFNTPGTSCYMKLFELEEGDGLHVVRGPQLLAPPINEIRAAPARVAFLEAHNEDGEAIVPPPAPLALHVQQAAVADDNPNGVRINARVQQGLARGNGIGGAEHQGMPMQGLQRFLQMAGDDEEDEWDSDELPEGVWPNGFID